MQNIIFIPIIFFFISFVFSMLGMGGSQLYIPILFWAGLDFKTEAIPLGILLNMVNSISAAVTYTRKKLIDFKVALPFGLSMVVFAPVGTWINIKLPTGPVIVIFALFTATAAFLMLFGWSPEKKTLSQKKRYLIGIFGGSILGFFAGLIGRGGGSFVVPLLYMSGLEAKVAAATSSFVVSCSGVSSFISHIFSAAHPDVKLWIFTVLAVFTGSQLGSNLMATKIKSKNIKYVFGIILLLVSALLIIQSFKLI